MWKVLLLPDFINVTHIIHASMQDIHQYMELSVDFREPNFKIWNKSQPIIILRRTKHIKGNVSIGNKQQIMCTFKYLITRMTQRTDYINKVIKIATSQYNEEQYNTKNQIMDQSAFPFRLFEISLSQYNGGVLYMIIPLHGRSCVYISTTYCIRSILISHRSGYNYSSTPPENLIPNAILPYIFSFDRK